MMEIEFEERCPHCGSFEVFYFSDPETDIEGYECDNCLRDSSIPEMPTVNKCAKCGAAGVALARPHGADDWMCLKCDAEFYGTIDYEPENDREPEQPTAERPYTPGQSWDWSGKPGFDKNRDKRKR